MIVFNKGINIGLKNKMFFGGQFNPISIEGASELCKKFQKKEIKRNISEIINKIILNLIRFIIKKLWLPWKVLSRIMSRHHVNLIKIIKIKLIKKYVFILKFINIIFEIMKLNVFNEVKIGQGLKVKIK